MKRPKRNTHGGQVPPGFVLVEAILTADQVYIVRQWAELAKVEMETARAAVEASPAKTVRQGKGEPTAEGLYTFELQER